MSSSEVDVVVIGAGVVGLACAAEIAARDRTVCLLERHPRPGLDTSTHNSGVIHAGLLLSSRLAEGEVVRRGQAADVRVLRASRCAARPPGKLIVAPSSTGDTTELEAPATRAASPTASQSRRWSIADFVRARESRTCAPTSALWSGSTGIVEPEAFVRALKLLCDARDVMLVVGSAAVGGEHDGDRLVVRDAERTRHCRDRRELPPASTPTTSRRCSAARPSDLPVPRRVRRVHAGQAAPGERSRLPAAPRVRTRARRARDQDDLGIGVLGPTVRFQARKDDYEADRLALEDFLEPTRELLPGVTLSRPPTGRQRHPRQAAPARGVVRRFHDPAGPADPGVRAGCRHRLAGLDLISRDRKTRGRNRGRRD